MVKNFKCKHTEALFNGKHVNKFANIEIVATRKLQMIDAAIDIKDLRIPPANRLEQLQGTRKNQYSKDQ